MDSVPIPLRILVVEDNGETRLLLRHLLAHEYDVELVSSVDEAMQAVNASAFDALIIDINLGEERTGLDVLDHARSKISDRPLPALALTAYALPGDGERFIAAGFDAYVSKPFTRRLFLDAVRSMLPESATPTTRSEGASFGVS